MEFFKSVWSIFQTAGSMLLFKKKIEKLIQLKDLREKIKLGSREKKSLKLILMHTNSFWILAGLEIWVFSHLSKG